MLLLLILLLSTILSFITFVPARYDALRLNQNSQQEPKTLSTEEWFQPRDPPPYLGQNPDTQQVAQTLSDKQFNQNDWQEPKRKSIEKIRPKQHLPGLTIQENQRKQIQQEVERREKEEAKRQRKSESKAEQQARKEQEKQERFRRKHEQAKVKQRERLRQKHESKWTERDIYFLNRTKREAAEASFIHQAEEKGFQQQMENHNLPLEDRLLFQESREEILDQRPYRLYYNRDSYNRHFLNDVYKTTTYDVHNIENHQIKARLVDSEVYKDFGLLDHGKNMELVETIWEESHSTPQAHPRSKFSLLDVKNETLVVAAYLNFFPIAYRDQNGNPAGLDIELLQAFCDEINVTMKIQEGKEFNTIWNEVCGRATKFKRVDDPRADIAAGGIAMLSVRMIDCADDLAWSIPYFWVQRTLLYNTQSNFDKPDFNVPSTIQGIILKTKGSTGDEDMDHKVNSIPDQKESARIRKLLAYGTTDQEDLRRLLNGQVQGLMRGSLVAKRIIKDHPTLAMIEPWNWNQLSADKKESFRFPIRKTSKLKRPLDIFLRSERAQTIVDHYLQAINGK